MAYALVGSRGAVATGTTSCSPTFGQATTAGNLLILVFESDNGASTPTGWTLAGGSTNGEAEIFYKANCGAGETAPTVSCLGSTVCRAMLMEFSGGATTSPLDRFSTAGPSFNTPQVATMAGADAAAGELLIAVESARDSKADTTTTAITLNNGATALGNDNNDATSTIYHYRFVYGITTGNSAADTASMSSTSMNLADIQGAFASFKLAAVVAASIVADTRRVVRNSLLRR